MRLFALFGGVILLGASAQADVKLPALFSDNMVFQRNQSLPVWGWADPGEAVSVKLDNSEAKTTADANGNWKVTLPARATGENLTLTVTGKNTLAINNAVMGEVWVCSGQSNMAFNTGRAMNAEQEVAAANFPNIRLFRFRNKSIDTPQTDVNMGSWVPCTPDTVKGFSAVGYFFGRDLHNTLNVPIGLISSSWGGTPSEAWTTREALEATPDAKAYLDMWDKNVADYPAAMEKYKNETLPAWQAEVDKAKAAGTPEPRKPGEPQGPASPNRPANLFNGMIAPLIPFAIKGAIWYQGESNSGRSREYATVFPAMIKDWRARWSQGDFPFIFVQLANFQKVQTNPVEPNGWPMIRESQAKALALPHTGMSTAIDLADADNPGDIHPHNKQDVGKRLALVALATEYGQKVIYAGPTFDKLSIDGNKARVQFKSAEGLQFKGDKLNGFAIAGDDNNWQWADATIEGNTVVLSSPQVANPTKVRYNWAINPIGNLYNGANLPAFPFRTDTDSRD